MPRRLPYIFFSTLCCFLIMASGLSAQSAAVPPASEGLQPIPMLTGRIVDAVSMISDRDRHVIEQELLQLERTKGAQVVVLTVSTTQPEEIEQYAIRVADQWKIGRKGIDDGVILLIAKQDRRMRLEVGYGLEGALSDLISKRIIGDIITPNFRKGDFSKGITDGVDAIVKVVNGEALPRPSAGPDEVQISGPQLLLLLFFGAVGLILMQIFCPGLLTAIGMAAMSSGNGRSSGGGGFGGGGGGFGGGGASGSW